MKILLLMTLTIVASVSAFAAQETLTCDSSFNNGASRTCYTASGQPVERFINITSAPIYGTTAVIPCVVARDFNNNVVFRNYLLTGDKRGVTVWGGCSLQATVQTQDPYYFSEQTFSSPNGDFREFPIGPNADQVLIVWQNGRCVIGKTLAWDLNRQVVAVNKDCVATLKIRHRQ